MTEVNIVESDSTLRLTLSPGHSSIFKKILLAIVALTSILLAVFMVFFKTESIGSFIWAFLLLLIFYVSFRSLLWSIKGKEVIEIGEEYINHMALRPI